MELVPFEEIENCKCEEIDIKSENIKSLMVLAKQLGKFCVKNKGTGLSAPQVGIFRKMMIFLKDENKLIFAINPVYFKRFKVRSSHVESCLSYPKKEFRVKRTKEIVAKFWTFDEKGKTKEVIWYLKGRESYIFQHETDHLNGITINMIGKQI